MKRTLLALAVLAACGTSTPPADSAGDAPAPAPAPGVPPVPDHDVGDGAVRISARVLAPGQELEVVFVRPGKDGCYRQGPVTTELGDHVITHSYTTSREGDTCTEALVPGGFEAKVKPPSTGQWEGRVIVDGKQVALYFVDVGA
jgi:hypothetical protein